MADLNIPTKYCPRCDTVKSLHDFNRNKHMRDGYQTHCRTCCTATNALYHSQHRESRAKYKAAYDRQHKDKIATYRSMHRDKIKRSKDNYRRTHKEQNAIYNAQWQRCHPDIIRAKWNRRRARKKIAGGHHTATDIQRQGAVQKWRCWWCGEDCKDRYHIDHLVPLSRGGHNGPGNIVIACPHCNLSKHDRLPDEWAGRLL